MDKAFLRWQELFEGLRMIDSLDSQALYKQALPCFYKIRSSEPGDDSALIGASRVGGLPDLPSSLSWPVDGDGRLLTFLAQVNFKELEPGFAPYLPRDGWLYFFIEELDMWNDIPHRVFYFDGPGDELQKSEYPDPVGGPVRIYRPYQMHFDTGFTLYGGLMDALLADHPEWLKGNGPAETVIDHFQRECTRIGGHPMSFQSLSEQYAYLKLSGLDDLYRYGTDLYSLEGFIRRERLEEEDPDLLLQLRTDAARQIEEYRRDFADHKQRMRSIRPIFVLGSENDMLWGDAGFLQFFMHEADLAKRDFSRTYCEVIST